LGEVESLAEELLLGPGWAAKNINRLAKEKFGRTVEGKLVEEWLQVDSGAISGDFGYQMLNVRLKSIEVSYLDLGKAWADERLEDVSGMNILSDERSYA
jgi:hypothetical protein